MEVKWTYDRLAELSLSDRHRLWINAKRIGVQALVSKIESSGLPYGDPKGVKLDSPLGRAMNKIINSEAGRTAAIEATLQGMPALAGIDPLLSSQLGQQYAQSYEATVQAGYLVAKMMRRAGYENSGRQARLPEGCVAKTGEIYQRVR